MPDGANTAFGMPEDEVPYLAYPNDKGASKNVYSSGDAVYKWKVFLNYKLSTADPTILQETIKYAFTEEDFVKHGSVFTEKTKISYRKIFLLFPIRRPCKRSIRHKWYCFTGSISRSCNLVGINSKRRKKQIYFNY